MKHEFYVHIKPHADSPHTTTHKIKAATLAEAVKVATANEAHTNRVNLTTPVVISAGFWSEGS